VVGVDTSLDGRADGRLEEADLEALDGELGRDGDTPTVLAMHHPPVLTGIRALDAIGLPAGDRARLGDLLGRHPQVQTVACGHVHRTMTTALGGAAVLICPGVSSQLRLDLRPDEDLPIEMTGEPAGLAVHVLVDGGIRSHVLTLPDD
jgi:3',5'-cyclic AMP phosphodiesterase CpdA